MLTGILSISGQGGLFKMLSQGNNSLIVENLVDGKKTNVTSAQRISALQDISMYTTEGDVRLSTVMSNIFKYTKGAQCIDAKKASAQELKDYMDNVLPTWDKEHIYNSDLKRLFTWYNILQKHGIVREETEKEAQA
ncbi:MAG: DUF5606 domain-containing protein [Bacteroidales bacterium]|nr:DUF5606 domain-containing protein [Bacteroidales bacterium]